MQIKLTRRTPASRRTQWIASVLRSAENPAPMPFARKSLPTAQASTALAWLKNRPAWVH
jgi:hypothetical protein